MILLKGAPGSGKTTLIDRLNLRPYTLGYDMFRELYAVTVPVTDDDDAALVVGQRIERQIVQSTKDAVENRLKLGALVVIDATNVTLSDQKTWRDLGRKYGYQVGLLDVQGDLTDEQLLERNAQRADQRVVDEIVLHKAQQSRESGAAQGVRQVDNATHLARIGLVAEQDFNHFDKVVVIGDVHSCADTLKEAIAEHGDLDDPDIAWVFLGDLFDRGPDAVGVFELLAPRVQQANVLLIEGNHELNLRRVLTNTAHKGGYRDSRVTRDQLLAAGYMAAEQLAFLDHFAPFVGFTFAGQRFFASHGGVQVDKVPYQQATYNVRDIPDYYFIYGAAPRAYTWKQQTEYGHDGHTLASTDVVQFHGHRNGSRTEGPKPMDAVANVWNLESGVETGGKLSVAVIDGSGKVTGHQYVGPPVDRPIVQPNLSAIPLSQRLAADEGIRAKDIGNGITAYNFTKDTFHKGNWNPVTTAARGLFIRDDTVVARGYEKFFNLGESHGYTKDQVLETFELPVRISEKANGFLMIVANVDGELVYYTKGGPTPFAKAGQELFERRFNAEQRQKFAGLLRRTNVSVTFEVILENDPHLTTITGEDIVFLDVINNAIDFAFRPELEQAVQAILNIRRVPSTVVTDRKRLAELIDYYQHDVAFEGAVLLDATGRMTKIKSDYYSVAKSIRGPLTRVLRGTAETLPEHMATVQRQLVDVGIWGNLEHYTKINPHHDTVLDMPRILKAINFKG